MLTKVIVANMLPLSLVDNVEFRELMAFIEPQFKVPCRRTLTNCIDSMKTEVQRTVRSELEAVPAMSLTCDIWISLSSDAYMSRMVTYITNNWEMKTHTLANMPMEDRHTQTNIAACLKDCAQSWALTTRSMRLCTMERQI